MRLHILDANQAKKTRGGGGDVRLRVFAGVGRGRPERSEDGQGRPDPASRRVDGHVGSGLQTGDACAVLIPLRETVLPSLRGLGGVRIGRGAVALRLAGINPRREVRGSQVRKCEQKIAEIALGIDGQDRNAIDGRLFDE